MKDVAIRNKDFVDGHFELTKMMEEFCYINCNFFTSPSKIMFDELHNNIDMDNVEYEYTLILLMLIFTNKIEC